MTTLQAWLRRAGALIAQGSDNAPGSGVWTTHVTREAIVAKAWLSAAVIGALALAWLAAGRHSLLWLMLTLLVCARAIALTGHALAVALDRHPERPPSNALFLAWAGLTALIGLPLGHLVLAIAPRVQPLALTPFFRQYFPELIMALVIGVRYWRLVIVRLWFERLATEKLRREAAEQGRALAEARLHMLEAHVEPQFLFDTLSGVQQLVRSDAAQADVLLVQLVSYLRQAIPDVRGTASTLGREFALIRTYLDIVRLRGGGRLQVTLACDDALAQVAFPPLIIHTLVEHAVKAGAGAIAVLARREPPGIRLSVEGCGAGQALDNVRERLALAYQDAARLDLDATGGVIIRLPLPGGAP
jgi:hypothetical protein